MAVEIIKCPVCGKDARITYEENRVYQMSCVHCHNAIFHQDTSFDKAVDFFERCMVLPCKVGDTINAFRFSDEKGLHVVSDKVTSVTTNKNGYTVKTKEKFYPIKECERYDFAPISQYPKALADFYIGTREEAERKLLEATP